jgi:hypothetical protein
LADHHSQGNLGISVCRDLTCIAVTCANILTSVRSSMAHAFAFIAEQNALLPLMNFIEDWIPLFKKWNPYLFLNK